MYILIKLLLGFLFSLGMAAFTIYKHKEYGLLITVMIVVTFIFAAIIFLGQLISTLGV